MKEWLLYWRAMFLASLAWDRQRAGETLLRAIPIAPVMIVVAGTALWLGYTPLVYVVVAVCAGVVCNMYVMRFIYSRPGVELHRRLLSEQLERLAERLRREE